MTGEKPVLPSACGGARRDEAHGMRRYGETPQERLGHTGWARHDAPSPCFTESQWGVAVSMTSSRWLRQAQPAHRAAG